MNMAYYGWYILAFLGFLRKKGVLDGFLSAFAFCSRKGSLDNEAQDFFL